MLLAGIILTDAAQRAPLAFNGPLGMNAVVAGRFYGVSNTAFALAAASLLVAITAWAGPLMAAQSGSRERQRALTVAFVHLLVHRRELGELLRVSTELFVSF